MRILLLWDYYESYLRQFYFHNHEAVLLPFADQNRLLLSDGFNWPAYMVPEFRRLGHEAEAIVGNADAAQNMWARENGKCRNGDLLSWRSQIVREQIRKFRPNILWLGGANHYLGDFIQSVREYCGAVVGWRAAVGGERLDWTGVDCVLSSHSNFVDMFRKMGLRSDLMLPCMDATLVSECLSSEVRRSRDVTFYGTLSSTMFTKRLDLLDAVTRKIPCHIYADRVIWQCRPRSPIGIYFNQIRYIPFKLRTRLEPPAYGKELLRLLAGSKIVLNSHVDGAKGLAGNIRMFESTAMGALLLTEESKNLTQIYEPGKEVVTYRSSAEAIDRIRYYLDHPDERETIARAGQRRTLQNYNSRIRAEEALRIFSSLSPARD